VDEDVEFNDTFRVEITGITSIKPAEMSAQLLVNAIGMEKAEKYVADFLPKKEEENEDDSELDIPEVVAVDVETEEEKVISEDEVKAAKHGLMNEIRIMMEEDYSNSSKTYTSTKLLEELEKHNDFKLPEDYLKRWLEVNNQGRPISEAEYENSKEYLRKSFLIEQTAKQLGVYVSYNDIEVELREDFYERSDLNPEDPKSEEQFQQFYAQLLKYDETIVSQRQMNKNNTNIGEKIEEVITINKKTVDINEFREAVEAENEAKRKAEEEKKAASVEEPVAEEG